MSTLDAYIREICERCEASLDRLVPGADVEPVTIHRAMRHSLFAGGKRLRPVAAVAAAEACGGGWQTAEMAACAVEMLHTYSLVHDDLPCMDDDDLRRGKPTCHVVYGEGVAVLAGDALLTAAFGAVARIPAAGGWTAADYVAELARAGGSTELIGGQVLDLEGEGKKLGLEAIERIHEGKTAALLTASLKLGAMSAGADAAQLQAITEFGYNLGMAFQVIDDILDATATTEQLGKTAGKDAAAEKSTYVTLLGLEAARGHAAAFTAAAREALAKLPEGKRRRLEELADYLLEREN